MGIYLAEQTVAFLSACLLGAALGLLYDLFRILRIAIPTGRGGTFAQDVFYFILCAVATFLFLLTAIDGVVRCFLLVGELIGAVLYHCTLGVLVMKVSVALINAVKAVIAFLFRYIFRPVWRLIYWIVTLLLRPVRFLGGILKKCLQRMKFRLKVRRMVLYNGSVRLLKKRLRFKRKRESRANGPKPKKEKP